MIKLILVLGISMVAHGQTCRNPKGESGVCMPLTSCTNLMSILRQTFITQDDYQFILQSTCSTDANKVCCVGEKSQKLVKPVSLLPTPGSGDCGIHSIDKIYGGSKIAIDQHPWMVLIGYNDFGRSVFGCGGVLINNRYVLTAAHCIRSSPKVKSVRLGEWNTKTEHDCNSYNECADPVVDVPVEETIVHEDYRPSDKNSHHDIALIRLSRPVSFTYFIKPICLPSARELRHDTEVGKQFTVAGWGRTEKGVWSDVKLKVDVKGVDLAECGQTYGNQRAHNLRRVLIPAQMCAGGKKDEDSCGGDSGGPLMGEYHGAGGNHYVYLAGVVSYGPTQCGLEGWPGVYTRVTSYLDWIQSKIRS